MTGSIPSQGWASWGQLFGTGGAGGTAGTGGVDIAARRQGRLERIFQKADTDGNGSLSKDEFSALYAQIASRWSGRGSAGALPSVDDLFKMADADNDGSVSQDELIALFKKLREQMLQTNAAAQSSSAGDLFKTADADGDGTISQDEFEALLQKLGSQAGGVHRHRRRHGAEGQSAVGAAGQTDPAGLLLAMMNSADASGSEATAGALTQGNSTSSLLAALYVGGSSGANASGSVLQLLLQGQSGSALNYLA